jgi:hypothetical protein
MYTQILTISITNRQQSITQLLNVKSSSDDDDIGYRLMPINVPTAGAQAILMDYT